MMDVGRHPLITLYTYSEIEDISGYVGNFHIKVRRKARYVDENACTSCGDCLKDCPVIVPDEYQEGLSVRKAIYQPFPQAVPSTYTLDMDACLGNNPIACGKCLEACEPKCIDYDMTDSFVEFDVGTVIVATGIDVFDPRENDEFGYGKYLDVITTMEFERLMSGEGPTEGHLIRISDRKKPKKIGFIQCVGSRSEKVGNKYCSNICCMNTIKDTLLINDHYPDIECTVFYMDIRAFGKGFEDLFMRSKAIGTRYIRGIPGNIEQDEETGKLKAYVENTLTGKLENHDFDMIVLSVGLIPRIDNPEIRRLFNLSQTSDGFLQEAHPKLKPIDAPTKGIYFAGCVEAPKDVKDSVIEGGAAAARASILLNAGQVSVDAITAYIDEEKCKLCGICTKVCPYHAITESDRKKKIYPKVITAACAGCGTCGAECPFEAITMGHFDDLQYKAQIEAILSENPQDKILTFACNWCSYPGADTAGTSRIQYPPTARLIRTMCSGRVDSKFVLYAFKLGAPIVLVSGCHYSDCHYIDAVLSTQKRIDKLWNKLEKLGIRPERLQLEWVSSAQGPRWAEVMTAVEKLRQQVTPEEIEYTKKVLKDVEI